MISSTQTNGLAAVFTIGEALVDLIEQADTRFQACLGGSVCNFTLGLARQGVATTYLNPLSRDRFGRMFAARLLASGVRLGARSDSSCPTSLALVSLDPAGVPSYAFHRQGVADRDIDADALIAGFPDGFALLHTGGLALVAEDLEKHLTAMHAANARGAMVSIDANLRPQVVPQVDAYVEGVLRALRQAQIAKLSDEDCAVLGLGDKSPGELAEHLFANSSLQMIALTRGAQAAVLMTRHACVEVPVPGNLPVVDTVGAGDCFHAGLIAYLARNGKLDPRQNGGQIPVLAALERDFLASALRHAIAAASVNIMRVGCDPATWEETCAEAALPIRAA